MPKSLILQEQQKGTIVLCPIGKWISVGRASNNDLSCKDKHVSRNHLRAQALPDGRLHLADRSSYGTWVNGEKIGHDTYAEQGDTIVLGTSYKLKLLHGLLDDDASYTGEEEPKPPRRLGAHYILLRQVGRGGMGIVYEAYDGNRKRRCAVKWLREGGRASEESMDRFKREVMLQGSLSDYPGVVKVYDLGAVMGSGEMYCVMEFVDGESFLHKIQRGINARDGVRILARVARAVDYAHENGVVHRDIKPGNIMVTDDGSVRLTDFGIAKALDHGGNRTMTGRMLGTPGYMAPEQINDAKRVEKSADVYALGAVLYTVLTGKLPVRGRSMKEALNNVRKGKACPSPREYNPDVDPILEAACMRALSHDPKDRFPSAATFAKELERWLKETTARRDKVSLQGPG